MKVKIGSLVNCLFGMFIDPKFIMSVNGILTVAQMIVGIACIACFVDEIYAWFQMVMFGKDTWVFLIAVFTCLVGTLILCLTQLLTKTIFEVLYHLVASIGLCYATFMFKTEPCTPKELAPSFKWTTTMGFSYAGAHFLGALWSFISYKRS